jgi:hypothetical protein
LSCMLHLSDARSWAGRSAWYDRHVGIVEVPGSNPGPSTIFSRKILEPIIFLNH